MEKKIPLIQDPSHPKPVTRRDFLSQGMIAFSACTMVPSLFGRVTEYAMAEDCGSPSTGKKYIPFIVIDCAGGAALPANFLVRNKAENLLSSYNLLGWDPKPAGALNESYGLPMAQRESKILQGINEVASAEARKNFKMGAFCHFADIDTPVNQLSAISLLSLFGYRGKLIQRSLGNNNSPAGGNSGAPFLTPAMKPLYVSSIAELEKGIGLRSEPFQQIFNTNTVKVYLQKLKDLNQVQVQKWEKSEEAKKLQKNLECAQKENEKLVNGLEALDARKDPIFQQIYQINTNSDPRSQSAIFSSIVKNALSGDTGAGVLSIGGCDYHDNTSTTGDNKDLEIGRNIGRVIQSAHRMNTPVFFQLITDGGCSNSPGTRIWRSDAPEKCMTVIGYYDPKQIPTQRRTQVGWYTEGQGADFGALTGLGKSPLKVACAVFANYLNLLLPKNEFQATFDKVVPRGTFKDTKEIEDCLIFG